MAHLVRLRAEEKMLIRKGAVPFVINTQVKVDLISLNISKMAVLVIHQHFNIQTR